MTTRPSLRLLFAAALLATLGASRQAHAGRLAIQDDAHVFSPADASKLRSALAPLPFDARLAVTSAHADTRDLSRYVGSLVTEPNMVAIGLDPEHHHVQVHFGTGSRIPHASWPEIERAGNEAFRRGDWEAGALLIFRAAAEARVSAPSDEAVPTGGYSPSLFGPGTLLLIVAGAIGIAVYFARKRAAAYGPLGGPGYGPSPYSGYGPGYPPAAGGGMGPVGGGLIGAGLGGLAGYELGKLEGEREAREGGGPAWDRANVADDSGGSFDEGGGGSSWDDDGGGFDGGGGDLGGGGSDF